MRLLYALTLIARTASATDWLSQAWDAIVVGAGPAGIIVADRLSEAGYQTLLLEQGGKSYSITGGTEKPDWLRETDLSRVDVPGLYNSIFAGKTSLLCASNITSAFQACTLGGNSAINAGLYFQPPSSDWDGHAAGWQAKDMEDATRRLITRQPPAATPSADAGYDSVHDWIVNRAGYRNVSFTESVDNKTAVFGRPVFNYIDGQRGGPVRTYLQSALSRTNFRLESGIRVSQIDQTEGKASGVQVLVDGIAKNIKLSRKGRVVLSAGALMSPAILMTSGIGPNAKIPNSAVGNGLFDNPNTFITLSGRSVRSYTYSYDNPPPSDEHLYLSSRRGPYSSASPTAVFWNYVNGTGVQGTVMSSGYADQIGNSTITLNIYGTSGLASSGHVEVEKGAAKPSGQLYYAEPRDAEAIASFVHSLFQKLPPQLTPLNIRRDATLAEIRTYITTPSKYAVGTVNHWSSSCRIGKCVDGNTKVRGTENIHVVDASILQPLTVNPQFGVMVAAEKGAEKILGLLRAKCKRTRSE